MPLPALFSCSRQASALLMVPGRLSYLLISVDVTRKRPAEPTHGFHYWHRYARYDDASRASRVTRRFRAHAAPRRNNAGDAQPSQCATPLYAALAVIAH